MRFPLWLHGQTSITFLVVSTLPKKPVVQLVPGTEVAVAPKRRKRHSDPHQDSIMSAERDDHKSKAFLRLQDINETTINKEIHGFDVGVALTSVIFIHPETADKYSLSSLELVLIVPRKPSKEHEGNHQPENQRIKGGKTAKEVNGDKWEKGQAVVRLLFSESVARGHVMLSQSLRLYLRAGLRSWAYLKSWQGNLNKEISLLRISPCQVEKFQKYEIFENNGAKVLDSQKNSRTAEMLLGKNMEAEMVVANWSMHQRIAAAISNEFRGNEDDKDHTVETSIKKVLSAFLLAWYLAQLDAIASSTGVKLNSLVIGSNTLLHFVVKQNLVEQFGKQGPADALSKTQFQAGDTPVDIFYVLSVSEQTLPAKKLDLFELSIDSTSGNTFDSHLNVLLPKVQLGDHKFISAVDQRVPAKSVGLTVSSLNWMGRILSDVIDRLKAFLLSNSGVTYNNFGLPLPGHILIYGPPGSGKTLLATVAGKSVQEGDEILAHIVNVSCSRLASEKPSTVRQEFASYIAEALDHAPSVIIFDDLDSLIPSSSNSEGLQQPLTSVGLDQFLVDIIDEYEEKRRTLCGIGPVAFIATAQLLTNLPQTLTSSGRFDFHVKLPAPAAAERAALLNHELQRRSLECSDDIIADIASKCDGYDAYDIEILVDRSVHSAVGRCLSSDLGSKECMKPLLVKDDFLSAMHDFLPVAMRDITKPPSEGSRSGWEDVGGLQDIQNAIKEMIELPSKFPNIFAQAPLRMRSNVLLYGPPGCGKTHIVGAAASSCSLRFISVKGPELLNKYIGASEQAVRDIFSKAAAAAPCLLFFDEFDSIAPKRGHDNTGVTDRVVNQFLTELDGVEVLTGVFVFAATSRPDLLDAALLRPGRLDRLLFCDFPTENERLDILKVLSRKLPLANDVDLAAIARVTEGFSGADLQALLSDAQLEAVHNLLGNENESESKKMPIISDSLLKVIASKAKSSVSDSEKQRLYDIYRQFLDSKRSVAAQSRDAKGKRATLA
ncbi:OLC1v1016449C1 [Oldenlandia corymbosa var. corymbosa]|nr:OLC1v1016449C1 [Oldenlandia corymbosa var. corymbosa]